MKNIYRAEAEYNNRKENIMIEAKDTVTAMKIAIREFLELIKFDILPNDKTKAILIADSMPLNITLSKVKLRS